MKSINKIIEDIIEIEGPFVDNPDDRGGPTCWGITEKVARQNGYFGDMRNLPKKKARSIYLKRYFIDPGFDVVYELSNTIAVELTDTGINMGQVKASIFLQRCLNVFNNKAALYQDLIVDGAIGANTISALNDFLNYRGVEGEKVLLTALNCLQGAKYIEITEADRDQETFTYGWLKNRVVIRNERNN